MAELREQTQTALKWRQIPTEIRAEKLLHVLTQVNLIDLDKMIDLYQLKILACSSTAAILHSIMHNLLQVLFQ